MHILLPFPDPTRETTSPKCDGLRFCYYITGHKEDKWVTLHLKQNQLILSLKRKYFGTLRASKECNYLFSFHLLTQNLMLLFFLGIKNAPNSKKNLTLVQIS